MPLGYKHTTEARAKISESNRNRVLSEETKRKISEKNKGRVGYWLDRKHPSNLEWQEKLNESLRKRRFSLEVRKKMSEAHMKEKHWNWQGGITPINRRMRKQQEYRIWRDSVFTRDNYICQSCGLKTGGGHRVELNADHIKPFALFPELRFAINNGRTLCKECHRKTETFGGRILNYQP